MTTELEIKDDLSLVQEEEPKKMASGLHSFIASNISFYLSTYIRSNPLGWVFESSATYNFKDGQPKRQPDVSFVSLEKMPDPPDEELTAIPDLAVEVVSKNDTAYEIEKKVRQYQQAGVKVVWIVYPVSQTVFVYRLPMGLKVQVFSGDDELREEEILPGFKIKANVFFTIKPGKAATTNQELA